MAYTLVSSINVTGGAVVTLTTTPGVDTVTPAVDLITVCISSYAAGGTIVPIDNKGNTYLLARAIQTPGNYARIAVYYCQAPAVGTGHTWTITNGASCYFSVAVRCWTGSAASPLDTQLGEAVNNSATTLPLSTFTPTDDNCLVLGAFSVGQTGGDYTVSGLTELNDLTWVSGTSLGLETGYAIQTGKTLVAAQVTVLVATPLAGVCVAFKAAGGGSSPSNGSATLDLGPLTATGSTATVDVAATFTQTLGALTSTATVTGAKVLYAKAAGGNWLSASTWSAVSSAGSDSAGPPEATTPYDVVLDAGSGNVTIDGNASCRSLNCTGYTGTLTHNAGTQLAIGHFSPGPGNVQLAFSAGMTYTPVAVSSIIVATSSVTSPLPAQLFKTAGKTLAGLTVNGVDGICYLADDLTVSGPIIVADGSFFTDNRTVTCETLACVGGYTILTNSIINLTRSLTPGLIFQAPAPAFISANTSTIVIVNPSTSLRTFNGGGNTFWDLQYTVAGSTGGLTITGANTFHALRFSDASNARTLTLPAGAITTVTDLIVNGTAGKLMSILSSSSSVQATISSTRHQSCNYLSLRDSAATGGGTFYAGTTSTNVSNNTGWLFANPVFTLNQTLGALTLSSSAITDPYSLKVVAHGAAGYWPLDERVGATIARDLVGTRTGTLVAGVVAGRRGLWGRAMAFGTIAAGPAGGPGYIDLGAGPPALATAFTLEFWYFQSPVTNRSMPLVTKGDPNGEDPSTTPGSYGFLRMLSSPPAAVGNLTVQIPYPSITAVNSLTNHVPVQQWHHAAITFTPGLPRTRMYLDGVQDGDAVAPIPWVADNGSLVTYLGDYAHYALQGYGFDGLMQAVAWYPSALTDAQILEHYQLGLALASGGGRRPLSVLALVGDDMLKYNVVEPITTSDTEDIKRVTDAIYVGVTGDVVVVLQNGQPRTFTDIAAGSILPVVAKRVNATSTTAASLLALYVS